MSVTTRALVDGVRAVVGATHASDDPAVLARAAVDGMAPRVVVMPATTDEVASCVAIAAAEDLAVVPRGSGSALDLGRSPERVGMVLDVSRLARVVEYNADDLTVSVEAGVTAGSLATLLAARRQMLPVDPPGAATRTLGGLAATHGSGPLRARYGTLRDLVLGVRFVQADGVVTWGGSKVVKSVTGYDVPKLMVGALGTLGIVTELTLRLHPRADAERTLVVALSTARAAQELIARILDSTLQPNRLEVFDGSVLTAVAAPAGAVGLAVSFASAEAAVAAQAAALTAMAAACGASCVAAGSELWSRYEACWQRDAGTAVLGVGSLPARVADTLDAVAAAATTLGTAVPPVVGGCAAVGSFRVRVPAVAPPVLAAFVTRLRAAVAAWDGTVTVQAASREVRAAVDPWGPVPADAFALMRSIKATFDPGRLLNPGRFVGGL